MVDKLKHCPLCGNRKTEQKVIEIMAEWLMIYKGNLTCRDFVGAIRNVFDINEASPDYKIYCVLKELNSEQDIIEYLTSTVERAIDWRIG